MDKISPWGPSYQTSESTPFLAKKSGSMELKSLALKKIRLNLPGGRVYFGHVSKYKMHGEGTMTYPSGDKIQSIEGIWNNGRVHGQAQIQFANTHLRRNFKYIGSCKNSKFHGKGELSWISKVNGKKYSSTGTFQQGQFISGKKTTWVFDSRVTKTWLPSVEKYANGKPVSPCCTIL